MTSARTALGVAGRALIRRGDGRILLLKRAAHLGTDPGTWELPGGKMGYGESLAAAVAREVLEETGLTVTVTRPFHVGHLTKEFFWVTCVTFLCAYAGGEVVLSDEHEDHAWVELAEPAGRTYARATAEQLDAYVALGSDGSRGR